MEKLLIGEELNICMLLFKIYHISILEILNLGYKYCIFEFYYQIQSKKYQKTCECHKYRFSFLLPHKIQSVLISRWKVAI